MSRRAIEAASSALNIPVHADSRADLAVDQLVDNLILQLQVLPVPLFSAGVGRIALKPLQGKTSSLLEYVKEQLRRYICRSRIFTA